jgi:hypothetical protein
MTTQLADMPIADFDSCPGDESPTLEFVTRRNQIGGYAVESW